MEKRDAIMILKDIEEAISNENWKQKGISTVEIYRKGLVIANDKKIEKLIKKHKEYINIYGEKAEETITLGKEIDAIVHKIFNEKG